MKPNERTWEDVEQKPNEITWEDIDNMLKDKW